MSPKTTKHKQGFFLVEELAAALRVSNMTIYRYIKAGKIKAYKIGKEFRIGKAEFDTFLQKVKTK
jgi:putative molybdopterin biosynthesis protein